MNDSYTEGLAAFLLGLADDELILSHRLSEWTGHAPILEEDIAFTNLALDEMGHAGLWYARHAELLGEDPERYPDQLIFLREPAGFRNVQMVELPNGDWAFSMLRQYLFDAAESLWLDQLVSSRYAPLAEASAKIRQEERYHLRHTAAWVRRLGAGTPESNQRMQAALNELFPFALQLFEVQEGEADLADQGYLPLRRELSNRWQALVLDELSAANLRPPEGSVAAVSRRTEHTAHLTELLEEMQMVARLEPGAIW